MTEATATVPFDERPRLLVGLIGTGIGRSMSPALHEAEGHAQGLRVHYQIIDLARTGSGVEALPGLIDSARRMGFAGLNITHPCKQAVIPLLDELSDEARRIGAVNTVVFRDGRAIGHNTDCSGFAEPFRRRMAGAAMGRVVLLGAGGAGAAVAHAAMQLGTQRLRVVDLDPARAQALAAQLCAAYGEGCAEAIAWTPAAVAGALADAGGVIHATPTGMADHPGLPIDAALLRPSLWVAEVVYFPIETELLRVARALGCRTIDGGGMAVWQAVGAFAHFTGREPDAERMEAHFLRMLAVRAAAAQS